MYVGPRPARARHRVRDDVVEREDVVAVDADRGDAVGAALDGERRRGCLPARGHADRPVVVLADDHAGHAVDAGERHRGVEVGLARRAVADEAQRHGAIALELRCPRGADGLRELRAEAARPRDLVHLAPAHVRGHLPALEDVAGVAVDLREVGREREAADEHHHALAQGLEDPVGGLDRQGSGDRRGLLPGARAVEADAALALEEDHPRVEEAEPLHLAVGADEELGAHAGISRGIGRAVVAEDAVEAEVGRARGIARFHARDHTRKRGGSR